LDVVLGISDADRVERILALLEEDDRDWFVDRMAEPWQRRARRLETRDACIRDYGLLCHPLLSGRAMALSITIAIDRYRNSAWRFERDLEVPADPRRASLWKILHLNNGRSLSPSSVRNALVGVHVIGQKKPRKLATTGSTARR
jgi:hypothetical protein